MRVAFAAILSVCRCTGHGEDSCKNKMDREYFERLTLEQLHAEMKKRDLQNNQDIFVCIERLVKYEEERQSSTSHSSTDRLTSKADAADGNLASNAEVIRLLQGLSIQVNKIKVKQNSYEQIITRLTGKCDAPQPVAPSAVPNILYAGTSASVGASQTFNSFSQTPSPSQAFFGAGIPMGDINYNSTSVLSMMAPGHAVTLLASQIPNFNGSKEDDLDV